MDWSEYLLSGARSPLGFKKLTKRSKLAADFLREHRDLSIASHAQRHGQPGYFVPSMADTGNKLSVYISFLFMDSILAQGADVEVGIVGSGQAFGSTLESRIATGLADLIREHDLDFEVFARGMEREKAKPSLHLTDYWPYLSPPSRAGDPGEAQIYRALGRGHLIQPDVIVFRSRPMTFARIHDHNFEAFQVSQPQLFACISGKATIRSDRSQSSRYEGNALVRWRRGRPPHIVVVTAEPFPSRLGSLAWGLGDLDCVYHVNLPALYQAVERAEQEIGRRRAAETAGSSEELKDLIEHARLKDLSQLFEDMFGDFLPRES
jgi:hypothetical protein